MKNIEFPSSTVQHAAHKARGAGNGIGTASRHAARVRPRLAIKHILVPTDFSPASEKAIDYALTLAESCGARISLVHVVEPLIAPELAAYSVMIDDVEVTRQMRDKVAALAQAHGLGAKRFGRAAVRRGTAFHEITQAARDLKADIIVIATHGYTGLKHVLLGSTTERVVRYARCPVLVVPARS